MNTLVSHQGEGSCWRTSSGTAPPSNDSGEAFGPHLDSFVANLAQLGYARETVQKQLRLLNAFDGWLRQRGVVLFDLSDAVVALFLEGRRAGGHLAHGDPRTIHRFLDHLRGRASFDPRSR